MKSIFRIVLVLLALCGIAYADVQNPYYGSAPYFQAYLSGSQSVTASTWTKVGFNTKVSDSSGAYDNVTNFRFNPKIAGKYYVYLQVFNTATLAGAGNYACGIYLNGTVYAQGNTVGMVAGTFTLNSNTNAIVQMNGTTDYVEGWASIPGTTPNVASGSTNSFFGAYYLGP